MKTHVIQHTPDSRGGSTFEWLDQRHLDYTITKWFEPNNKLPAVDDFDFLIVLGGEMNVDQEELHPWMKAEKILIREALQKNKKVLGICLGAQLMAEVLGAKVGKHSQWEVGWWPVRFLNAGKNSIFSTQNPLMAFQFHGYAFETPDGAVRFATSEACPHQGFQWGECAVGLQFHPEATRDWVEECASEKLPSGAFVQTAEQMRLGNEHQPQLRSWYFKLLDNYFGPGPTKG